MNMKMNKKHLASENQGTTKQKPNPSGRSGLPTKKTSYTSGAKPLAKPGSSSRSVPSGTASTAARTPAGLHTNNPNPVIRQVEDNTPSTSGASSRPPLATQPSGSKICPVKRQADLAVPVTPGDTGAPGGVTPTATSAAPDHMAQPMAPGAGPSDTITAPGSTHPRKQISASERYYRTRRSAFRILERLKDIKLEDLTEEQSDSKAWAEAFITEHREKAKIDSAQGKRKRSSEGASAVAKRTKMLATQTINVTAKKSFADIAKESYIRAVIDRSSHDGAISQENWDLINRSLWKVYRDILKENPGPPPSCSDAGWFQSRVKLIRCADQRSVDLYTLAINRIGVPWPGARLDVVPREDIPNRPRSRAWIPDFHTDTEEVLEHIKLGNPELPTSDWKVAKIGEVDGKRRLAVIILNEESLDPLAKRNWKINYGFQSLTLHVYRQDVANKNTSTENTTTSAEANEVVTDNDEVASNSGMVGELFERVTLEDMGEYSDLSAMEDEESLPPTSDEENADQTVVGCPSITHTSDGEGCTNQSSPQ